ncbi:MAG: prolyl oligopeptidase family serine peptidase, partial [Xanthomonadales bacterium]|nr:prolyl oligopeptidase family serine peptidase [Xanthomonadales bacterium]
AKPMRHIILSIVLTCAGFCPLASATDSDAASGMHLDINGLYREPSLIGTRPAHAVWSPDSKRLAFLWNDAGHAFRDVWLYQPGQPRAHRLTRRAASRESENGVSEVAWAHDGSASVLYTLDDTIWLHATGARHGVVVATGDGIRHVTPSPDGKHLAWVANDGLWLADWPARSGEAQRVASTGDPALQISRLQWAANGSRLAFLVTDNRPLPQREIHYTTREGLQVQTVRRAFPGENTADYRVGVVEAADGATRYLDRPNDRDYVWNFGISSDGSRLFINGSDLLVKHHRIDLYELDSGERIVFYQEHDPHHLRPDWRAAWAPGDQGLVIMTDRDGYLHLYHQRSARSRPRALTSGHWEVASLWTDYDSDHVYFVSNRSHLADKQLYRVPINGGDVERVGPERHGTHVPVFSPDMLHAASLFSDDRTPHELYHIDLSTGAMTQITRSPRPEFYQQQWADVRYVTFPARTDGVTLVGRLSLPPDYEHGRTYPLIVGSVYSDSVLNQWGGRQSHPTWGLDQYLVANGYVLLNVNVRGSWGQGRQHNQGLRHGYGIVDIEDLHSGVEYLVREGVADPDRVGIWGSSYGGLMTMMSLFKKPGVYKVGIAGAPATNVAHAYPGQMWVMGPPTGEDQPDRYQSQSPLYHSHGLQDPLMIIHGTRDQVVLYSDTIAVVEDLVDEEKMFELVTLPGVGHGWDNEAPEVRRFSFRKMVAFFDRHLKDPDTNRE